MYAPKSQPNLYNNGLLFHHDSSHSIHTMTVVPKASHYHDALTFFALVITLFDEAVVKTEAMLSYLHIRICLLQ